MSRRQTRAGMWMRTAAGGVRATWRFMVDASRQEALQAADHYNKPRRDRSLEGFFVHVHIAWLYLLHPQRVDQQVVGAAAIPLAS